MRSEMGNSEEGSMIIDALRGRNLNDDDQASVGLQMKLIDATSDSGLPYEYNPAALKQFFTRRPLTVLTRVLQLVSVGGGFVANLGFDFLLKRSSPELEVKRAGQLRDLLTSLGPFYIKVRQVSTSGTPRLTHYF